MKIKAAKKYKAVYNTKKRNIILYSPRMAGKSNVIYDVAAIYSMLYPRHDIVIIRANSNSIKDSSYSEMVSRVEELNLPLQGLVSPPTIRGKHNTIYFKGIASDPSRTRSFKPVNPLSLIIVEETQQLKNEEELTHAMSSFIRWLDTDIPSHVIYAGNNTDSPTHWWYQMVQNHKDNPNSLVIESTYLDIKNFLSPASLDEIEFLKKVNLPAYQHIYLGEFTLNDNLAVYNFDVRKHVIDNVPPNLNIKNIFIGVDSAVRNDKTSCYIILFTREGYAFALPPFVRDPKKEGVISSREQAYLIRNYISQTFQQYNINGYYIPYQATVDCAATDMILGLREYGIQCVPFTEKKTADTLEKLNNAFGSNSLYLIKGKNTDMAIKELSENTFIAGKLDPAIPNDILDSLRYAYYYAWIKQATTNKIMSPLRGE